MKNKTKHHCIDVLLRSMGVRLTAQRRVMASYLFDGVHKHVTAETVHEAMRKNRSGISLATVYNNLHQFAQAGLLHEILADHKLRYFDTNIGPHHHFFDEDTGCLWDVSPADMAKISLPKPPSGKKIKRVDVTIRLRKNIKEKA